MLTFMIPKKRENVAIKLLFNDEQSQPHSKVVHIDWV